MTDNRTKSTDSRRRFLGAAATGALGVALGQNVPCGAAEPKRPASERQTVRDKFWIFTCPAGTDNHHGLPRPSRMTPAEGAFYLGVPNLMLIRCDGKPPMPADQYAIPFRPLKRVLWSITGSGGVTGEEVRKDALRLAHRFPNIVGFIMDDFFHEKGGQLSIEQLKDLRKQLVIDGRKRDLYVVVYTHQLDLPIQEHLEYCDKVTLWTWHAKELNRLDENFRHLEKVAPNHGKLLGLYIWDYPTKSAVPVELMKKQCQLGLKWLREGRLEGMIFLANTVLDVGAESGKWARRWIAEVGDQPL